MPSFGSCLLTLIFLLLSLTHLTKKTFLCVLASSFYLHHLSAMTYASFPSQFDPQAILDHIDFKIIPDNVEPKRDLSKNLACAYAPGAQLHLVEKPVPKAGPGQVVVHVQKTGICGSGGLNYVFAASGSLADLPVSQMSTFIRFGSLSTGSSTTTS